MLSTQVLDDDRIMSLVELALSRHPEERAAYLWSACAGDLQLFGVVWNYVQEEERMTGFLLDPLYSATDQEHSFEPGELVDDRFRILREVARGGMGVVYEAVDEKLDKRIAIKCAQAGYQMRLPPEVRNAREISHPNICKIFEIHTASTQGGEVDFFTMEFLDGETLAARLFRGPLPEPQARAIALQLCAGLSAAHHNQVVHGDLKTANVILTTGAGGAIRAVITDFGMARGLDASLRNAQSGLGGTPDYMAPELWKGGKASIASDIYALGVILFELVSGRRAHNEGEAWEERLTWRPPAVHPKWDRIVSRCVDPDPARRFDSADEIALAFAPSRSLEWFLGAAAAVLLAIASGVVTYERVTAPKETVRLALLQFAADKGSAQFAENLFRDTAVQLSRLKGNRDTRFKFVPVKNAGRKADTTGKELAALGATEVLHGTLESENGKVVLQAYLTDAHSNKKEWKAEYQPREMRFAPVALAGVVTSVHRLTPPVTREVNAAARPDYLAGLVQLRRNSTVDAALLLMERAVASDPDSPLTRVGLAEAEWFKYFLKRDRFWVDRTRESLRHAEIRQPDLARVHWISGFAVIHDVQVYREIGGGDRFANDEHVGLVVFDQ
jgi:TolB-like protein